MKTATYILLLLTISLVLDSSAADKASAQTKFPVYRQAQAQIQMPEIREYERPKRPPASFDPSTLPQALRPRERFGEDNQVRERAHHVGPGTYQAAFWSANDVDYFSLSVQEGWASWYTIEFEVIPPSDLQLRATIEGPQGENLEEIKGPSGKLWVALKNGTTATVKFEPSDAVIDYNFIITKGDIPDGASENNDEIERATLLNAPPSGEETEQGAVDVYLCDVVDHDGSVVGLPDWFSYWHASCRNDCITIRPNQVHIPDLGMTDEFCTPERTHTLHKTEQMTFDINWPSSASSARRAAGKGDLPAHYLQRYTISVIDKGETKLGRCGD